MNLDFVTFPAIVVICYLVGLGIKSIPSEKINKAIPFIVGCAGVGLGILTYFSIPGFSDNILNAVAIGAVSGLASTGVNQLYRQANKE